jgi:hypothetical protein
VHGRRDDRTIPKRQLVRGPDPERAVEKRERHVLHTEAPPCIDQFDGKLMRQPTGPGWSGRLHVEFLEHLHGRRPVILIPQCDRLIALRGLCRIGAANKADRWYPGNVARSRASFMRLFAAEIVYGAKSCGNTGARFAFPTLQPLEIRFAGAELCQIAAHQRGTRCVEVSSSSETLMFFMISQFARTCGHHISLIFRG